MSRVIVYQYRVVDTRRGEGRKARRWGTREAIAGLKSAQILEDSATPVDGSALNDGDGFTQLDFDPRSQCPPAKP